MARMYTKGRIKSADIILTDPYNDEINQSVGELNGGLDQNNMPLNSVTRSKLVPPVLTSIAGPPAQKSYVMPSQDYHISEYCDAATVQVPVSEWQLGWNKFEQGAGVNKTGFVLDFTSSEGMLKGEACLDAEMRQSAYVFKYFIPSGPSSGWYPVVNIKDRPTGEIGVFVNDVLVGRTGPLWIACGRHSYVVPFSTPIGSGPCHVDVRWIVDYHNEITVLPPYSVEVGINWDPLTAPFQIHHRSLWCRNEKR